MPVDREQRREKGKREKGKRRESRERERRRGEKHLCAQLNIHSLFVE